MATETSAEGGGSAGLPQLEFDTWPSQIFWLAVSLVVLYQLMAKVALPRISSVIEERADAIADDLDRADEYRRKAEEAEAAYDRALADARAKAQAIAAETRAEIQKEVDAETARADAEIAARSAESERRIDEIRENAMASVEEVAIETAREVVRAILPESADEADVTGAVRAQLG